LNDSDKGKVLLKQFEKEIGKNIISARSISGTRSDHNDFEIKVENVWLTVEHKGSKLYKPINYFDPPWKKSGQFYNGPTKKYRLAIKYAKSWYEKYIGSGILSKKYNLIENIPNLQEWIDLDACSQGMPKTKFGIELKNKKDESLSLLKSYFVSEFVNELTKEDEKEFKEDVSSVILTLNEKDIWLQIAVYINGQFYHRWHKKIIINKIHKINFNSTSDLCGTIITDCEYPITFILRWGNGNGISNIRIDLK
jgi:hypothetical protein